MDNPQAKFEGWAVLELFGHNREAGFITTRYFGDKAMFQLDVPEMKQREYELPRPDWIGGVLAAKGSKVRKEAKDARTRLISPGAVYAINPCTEATALRVLEELTPREIKIVELAKTQQIAEGSIHHVTCDSCGASAPEGKPLSHLEGCENADITGVDLPELEEETRL